MATPLTRTTSDPSQPKAGSQEPVPQTLHRQSWLAGAVVLVVLIIAGFLLYKHNHNQQNANNAQSYAFTYKTLKKYNLPGQANGSGMTFSAPSELTASGPPASAHQQEISLSQNLTINKQTHPIANLSALSLYSATPPADIFLKGLAANLANPKSPNYASSIKPLEDFVTGNFTSTYVVSFDTAKAFTDPNIKTNAWFVNFTAAVKKGTNNFPGPPLAGAAILAVGKNAYYYYYIDAVSYNWTGNHDAWLQVLNSLKIDQ